MSTKKERKQRLNWALKSVRVERAIQDDKWGGEDHDDRHTSHDWVAIIIRHLGRAVMWPFDVDKFGEQMVRVAAIAVAAVEWADRLEKEQAAAGKGK